MIWRLLRSARGFSLLEQALALPVVLGVVVGAVDVSSYMKGYRAVQEGVRASLRCTYTTDGKCVSVTPDETKNFYNIFLPPIYGHQFNYDGDGYWLEFPTYSYENFTARILDTVTFDVPQTKTVVRPAYFSANALVKYYLRGTVYPTINGTGYSNGAELNLGFSGGGNVSTSGSPGGRTTNTSSDGVSIGAVTFTIPHPAGNDPYRGRISDCFTRRPLSNLGRCLGPSGTHISLAIHGNSNGTPIGDDGQVAISWSQNGSGPHSLGGRAFGGPGTQNFFPRGLPSSSYTGQYAGWCSHYSGECGADYNDIVVEFDKPVTLHFRLRKSSGNPNQAVEWNMTSIQVFAGEWSLEAESPQCNQNLTQSQMRDNVGCTTSHIVTNILDVSQNGGNPVAYGDNINPNCSPVRLTRDQVLTTQGITPSTWIDYGDYGVEIPNVCGSSMTAPCVDGNIGVPEEPVWEPLNGSVIRNSSSASSICPPQSELMRDNGILGTNPFWREKQYSIHHSPVTFSDKDCSFQLPPPVESFPSDLTRFVKLDISTPRISEYTKHFFGASDPRTLKDPLMGDSRYQCSAVPLRTMRFDNSSTPPTSIFNGVYPELDCSWADTLKTEAKKLGLPGDAYFVPARLQVGDEVRIPGRPTDECRYFRIDKSLLAENQREFLGAYPDGEMPPQCYPEPYDTCVQRFKGSFPTGNKGEVKPNEKAKAVGLEAIEVLYPQAKTSNCDGGPHCVKFDVPDPDGNTMHASASVEVPMMFLLNKTVKVSYSASETWEGAFSK